MAFSRTSRFRGRSPRRLPFKRRAAFTGRNPARPRGLEQATFFIDETTQVDNSSGFETSIYTNLASIPLSVGNVGAGVISNSPEARLGTVLASTWRAIMVHGIVMDWDINQINYGGDSTQSEGIVWTCQHILTDKIDYNSTQVPAPSSLGSYFPFTNMWPVATLSTTSPSDDRADPATLPTRIHWTRTQIHWLSPARVLSDEEGILYVPNGQSIHLRPQTINKRLRVRVDDEHGLFLTWHFRNNASFDITSGARVFRRWARGTLYYRVIQ